MSDRDVPLPPPTFDILVVSLRMQAEAHMHEPKEGGAESAPDLRLARHFIDMLAMLQEKTRGNLTLEEQRLLDNTVTELRFRYLHVYELMHRKAAETGASND